MVAETSVDTYRQLLKDGVINMQEFYIVDALDEPMTSRKLAKVTGMERSSVTGRLATLVWAGLVSDKEKTVCPTTGRTVKLYRRLQ